MSAYIVDREHIRYLVSMAMHICIANGDTFRWYHNGQSFALNRGDRDHASSVGQMLWDENIRSIQSCYPDTRENMRNAPGPIGETFIYAHSSDWCPSAKFSAVQVLKACACYEYQSCEHDGWKDSQACAFIHALKELAIRTLPGWDAAEWGAPEIKQKTRRA